MLARGIEFYALYSMPSSVFPFHTQFSYPLSPEHSLIPPVDHSPFVYLFFNQLLMWFFGGSAGSLGRDLLHVCSLAYSRQGEVHLSHGPYPPETLAIVQWWWMWVGRGIDNKSTRCLLGEQWVEGKSKLIWPLSSTVILVSVTLNHIWKQTSDKTKAFVVLRFRGVCYRSWTNAYM